MDYDLLQRYLNIAQEAARLGGQKLQTDFGQIRNLREKGKRDPVTQSDLDAEQIILQYLKQFFPDHGFLSEETDSIASVTMPECSNVTQLPPPSWESGQNSRSGEASHIAPFRWIIDPLDGTMNYIHGLAQFGVSIALQYYETTIIGVVYQPLGNNMYTAVLGHGAFLNGKRLRVSLISTLAQSLVGTGFSASLLVREKQLVSFGNILQVCAALREPGSAALGLCDVARGAYESYWESGLMPWDVAAGVLLVTEAGGSVTNLEGDTYHLSDKDLIASNGFIHQELLQCTQKDRE